MLSTNAARRKYIKETKGTKRATWKLVIRKGRVPKADTTTAARAFKREGLSGGLCKLFLESQGEPGEGRSERSGTGETAGGGARYLTYTFIRFPPF